MTPTLGDRSLFPDLDTPHYFNAASVSPLAAPVTRAMVDAVAKQASGGVAAIEYYAEAVSACRVGFAQLVGGQASDVAFLGSTSAGIIAVAQCLRWRQGDRVVVFEGDFPANITPWQQAALRHGLELVWMKGDRWRTHPDDMLAELAVELKRGVRLVALSAVSFSTGCRRPVQEVAQRCQAAGAELFVDGIQAAGICELSMSWGIDYLAVGGHKWLGGPFGTGLLAVSASRWSELSGGLASWMSHTEPLSFLFGQPGLLRTDRPLASGPALFEGGAFNGVGAAGLAAALECVNSLGVDAISQHVDQLNTQLAQGMSELGLEVLRSPQRARRAGALVVDLGGRDVGEVVGKLAQQGVSVSSPDGRMRWSPHWSCDADDVRAGVSALRRALTAQ